MLDALTLDQLRVFVAVAEAGSFRAAAARLGRVQSAVSHAMANLEAELGLALFDRSGRRPVLTREGRALLEDARAALLKVDFLRARARGLSQDLEIELPIVVDTLFSLPVVAAALRDLRASHPSVGVRVSFQPLGGPLVAVREGRSTLGINVGGDFPDPRIARRILTRLAFVAVAAASHPLARRDPRELLGMEDLADHLQIVLEDPSPLSQGRDFGVLSPGTWRVDSQEVKHALILGGLGWGRLPLWLVARDLAEGRLVRLNATAFGPGGEAIVTAYLVHRTDAPLGPAARAFGAALERHAGVGPAPLSGDKPDAS